MAAGSVGAARWPNLGRHQPCPSGPSTAPQRAFGFSPTPSGQSSGPQSGASAGAGASLQVSFGARRKPTPAGGAARCSVAARERAIHQRQLACGNVSLQPRDAHRPPSSAGLRKRRSSGGLSKFASGSANVAAGGWGGGAKGTGTSAEAVSHADSAAQQHRAHGRGPRRAKWCRGSTGGGLRRRAAAPPTERPVARTLGPRWLVMRPPPSRKRPSTCCSRLGSDGSRGGAGTATGGAGDGRGTSAAVGLRSGGRPQSGEVPSGNGRRSH